MIGKTILHGYVNATSEYSRIISNNKHTRFREIIECGAITRSLSISSNIPLTFNHDRIIADGSDVRIYETKKGFRFTAMISDKEVIIAGIQGRLSGCSFTFKAVEDDIIPGRVTTRVIKDLILLEISVLDYMPAYSSGVFVRGALEWGNFHKKIADTPRGEISAFM